MEQTLRNSKWNNKETKNFLTAYIHHPNHWPTIASDVATRTATQARSFAQKTFIRIQKEVQIRRNNQFIHDQRYIKRHRPAPHSLYLASSSKKIIQKSLKRDPDVRNLEEMALKVHQFEERNREARRLGLKVISKESLGPKHARTAQRLQRPTSLGRQQGLSWSSRPKNMDTLQELQDKEAEQQEMFERFLSMNWENSRQSEPLVGSKIQK